jgi:hypothetical protein
MLWESIPKAAKAYPDPNKYVITKQSTKYGIPTSVPSYTVKKAIRFYHERKDSFHSLDPIQKTATLLIGDGIAAFVKILNCFDKNWEILSYILLKIPTLSVSLEVALIEAESIWKSLKAAGDLFKKTGAEKRSREFPTFTFYKTDGNVFMVLNN